MYFSSSNIDLDFSITLDHSAPLDNPIALNLSNSSPTLTLTLTFCKLRRRKDSGGAAHKLKPHCLMLITLFRLWLQLLWRRNCRRSIGERSVESNSTKGSYQVQSESGRRWSPNVINVRRWFGFSLCAAPPRSFFVLIYEGSIIN